MQSPSNPSVERPGPRARRSLPALDPGFKEGDLCLPPLVSSSASSRTPCWCSPYGPPSVARNASGGSDITLRAWGCSSHPPGPAGTVGQVLQPAPSRRRDHGFHAHEPARYLHQPPGADGAAPRPASACPAYELPDDAAVRGGGPGGGPAGCRTAGAPCPSFGRRRAGWWRFGWRY